MTFRRILTAMALLFGIGVMVALAPTTSAAPARQAAERAMPAHLAITTSGVIEYPYGVVPVSVTYHIHAFSHDARSNTLLAQAHVHTLSPTAGGKLSYRMHTVSVTLPVAISLYANQLAMQVGPGRTPLTVTISGSTYHGFLYTFPTYARYGQANYSRPSALGRLKNGIQVWNGQKVAAALNRLFSLS